MSFLSCGGLYVSESCPTPDTQALRQPRALGALWGFRNTRALRGFPRDSRLCKSEGWRAAHQSASAASLALARMINAPGSLGSTAGGPVLAS